MNIRRKNEELHQLTKKTIEELSIEDGLKLVDLKWNKPVVESICNLPKIIIKDLVAKVNKLKKKYNDTLLDIEEEIERTTKEFNSLIDELVGDEFDIKGLQELKKILGGE